MKLLSCLRLSSTVTQSVGGGLAKGLLIGAPCLKKCCTKVSQEVILLIFFYHRKRYAQAAVSILTLFRNASSMVGHNTNPGPNAKQEVSSSFNSSLIAVTLSFGSSVMGTEISTILPDFLLCDPLFLR